MLAGVNYPERSEEHARPCAVESPGPPGSSPVERAGREEPREPAVQPGLAPVAGAAEPVQVLQGERPPECLGSQGACDIEGQPVVELRGWAVPAAKPGCCWASVLMRPGIQAGSMKVRILRRSLGKFGGGRLTLLDCSPLTTEAAALFIRIVLTTPPISLTILHTYVARHQSLVRHSRESGNPEPCAHIWRHHSELVLEGV